MGSVERASMGWRRVLEGLRGKRSKWMEDLGKRSWITTKSLLW